MSTLISGIRGLSIAKMAVQIAAYGLVMWTYAEQQGLGDALVDGVKSLPGLPIDLIKAAGTPGGDQ